VNTEEEREMDKHFTVIHGPAYNPVTATVILNGVDESERLTPKLAIRAARVGCGHRNSVTVWDGGEYGYRLYKNTHRKVWKQSSPRGGAFLLRHRMNEMPINHALSRKC